MSETRDSAVGAITAKAREVVDSLADQYEAEIASLEAGQAAALGEYQQRLADAETAIEDRDQRLVLAASDSAEKAGVIIRLTADLSDSVLRYVDLEARFAAYKKAHPDTYRLGPKMVWAVQQIASKADLANLATMLADAKATVPALGGLSLRMGWRQYEADKSVLDAAKQIADDLGLQFSFRFMAGRFTPVRLLEQMIPGGYTAMLDGERIPIPFGADGSHNYLFEQAWQELVTELADWYEDNDCHLLHLSWYAGAWAELNHDDEIRNAPGYTIDRFIDGHLRLIDIAGEIAVGRPLVIEFPATGHGPLPVISGAINKHTIEVFGSGSRRAVLQMNGWSDTGLVGAPNMATATALLSAIADPPVLKAVQAIQPWSTPQNPKPGALAPKFPQFTVEQVRAALAKADSVSSAYIEVYLPTFLTKNGGVVWAQPLGEWIAPSAMARDPRNEWMS